MNELTDADRLKLYETITLGLHAQIFGVHALGDPEHSHDALSDNGEIHETVHTLVRLCRPRQPVCK